MARGDMTEKEWQLLEPLLLHHKDHQPGHPFTEHRRVINGIRWILRTSAGWRDLPERYGPWQTCYDRYIRWQRGGMWKQIQAVLKEDDQRTISGESRRGGQLSSSDREAVRPSTANVSCSKPVQLELLCMSDDTQVALTNRVQRLQDLQQSLQQEIADLLEQIGASRVGSLSKQITGERGAGHSTRREKGYQIPFGNDLLADNGDKQLAAAGGRK